MPGQLEQFTRVCELHRKHTSEKLDKVIIQLAESIEAAKKHREEIEKFLWKGNGKDPVDVRLDRNTQRLKLVSWIGGILFVALISAVGYMLKEKISGAPTP